jgi:4-amino-4-deoxy-L-arabinose transferase-like glycosyltransferase
MALAVSAGCAALVLIVFLITAALGNHILEIGGLKADEPLDTILFSSGAGFAILQLLLGILGLMAGLTVRSVMALLILLAIAGWGGWKSVFHLFRESAKDLSGVIKSGAARALGLCIFFFLGLEALLSTAPLTGSDAMHYHFTAPLLEIGRPEQPIFWLAHSFFVGLGHELIALGLVLGGDRLALLLIFFGGCLTAVALFQMARKWMPPEWSLAAALTFLMTPMVFWQISTAGSPDIWMGFYAVMAALAVGQAEGASTRRWLILASVYAGAGASIKYTGWILPAVIVLCVLWMTKSLLWAALCSAAALATGVFPLLRNFLWTGDPFFPFLSRWMGKVPVNEFGLEAIQADVHSHAFSTQPLHILYFLAAMTVRGADYGLGHYFGPVLLAFLPLAFFCNWRSRLVRVAAALCVSMLFANALTTQMARFLLPAYPLALALVIFGAAVASREGGAFVRFGCAATLALFGLFCVTSDTLYAKDFLSVAVGLESKAAFLNRMAPDYQAAAFVNSALAQRTGKALIFFRHSYYLRVPYENGDPGESWGMNPAVLTNPQALLAFLKEQNIAWVVKSPEYPDPLAKVFEECEKEGLLVPEARTETETLSGSSRVYNIRLKLPVVLMRVAN